MRWGMSDRWRAAESAQQLPAAAKAPEVEKTEAKFYEELIASKPALIEEKVKLHGQLIEEFNLSLLDRVSPEDLARQVKNFVTEYVQRERVPLNQKELEAFSE